MKAVLLQNKNINIGNINYNESLRSLKIEVDEILKVQIKHILYLVNNIGEFKYKIEEAEFINVENIDSDAFEAISIELFQRLGIYYK